MKIKIISGGYGCRGENGVELVMRGNTCEVPQEEAERLVGLGVAAHLDPVTPEISGGAPGGAAETGEGVGPGNSSPEDTVPLEGLETPPDGDPKALVIQEGHYTVDSLVAALSRTELAEMAGNLGIAPEAVKKCKNKTEIAALISEVEVAEADEGDGEAPPDLGAEAPVV